MGHTRTQRLARQIRDERSIKYTEALRIAQQQISTEHETASDPEAPGEQVCVHCEQRIIFAALSGMWIHLSMLSACDNGRTNAQPPNGSRWTPPEQDGADRG
jgi:hypothetical protein